MDLLCLIGVGPVTHHGQLLYKFHAFCQPHGLFNKILISIIREIKFTNYVYTSPLYQIKYAALGIEVTVKASKTSGKGRFNERLHISLELLNSNTGTADLAYLQRDSDD
jgi:hypothetical protein